MFYVRIKFSHSFKFQTNSSKTMNQVANDIIVEIEERSRVLRSIFSFMTSAACVFFIFMICQTVYYRFKFLTRESFDNTYITKDFRQIDLRRASLGKETVLPLNSREAAIYAPLGSTKLIKIEKVRLKKTFSKLVSATTKLCLHMAVDYALFWILDMIRYYGRFQSKVQAPNVPTLKISGKGLLADLLRSIVKAFQPMGITLEIDTVPCLPMPIPPDYDKYIQIAMLLVICWILTILEPYGLRLRQKVLCYYYPTRARQRAIWLYNHIMRSRSSFLKFARRQLRRKILGTKGITKITFAEYIRANIRPKCIRPWLGGQKQDACLLCGEVFRESDKVKPIRCKTPECQGIYCEQCFHDLQNLCTVCMSPIDYGDLSDISEEKDSSEDEARIMKQEKKRKCKLMKMCKKKSSDSYTSARKHIDALDDDSIASAEHKFCLFSICKRRKGGDDDSEEESLLDEDSVEKIDRYTSISKLPGAEKAFPTKDRALPKQKVPPTKKNVPPVSNKSSKHQKSTSGTKDTITTVYRSETIQESTSITGTSTGGVSGSTASNDAESSTKSTTDSNMDSDYSSVDEDSGATTTSSTTDYSYSYQYEEKKPSDPIIYTSKFKDLEKQDIPDYATMDSFREDDNISHKVLHENRRSISSDESDVPTEDMEAEIYPTDKRIEFIGVYPKREKKHKKETTEYSGKKILQTVIKQLKSAEKEMEEAPLLSTPSSYSVCKCTTNTSSSSESDSSDSSDNQLQSTVCTNTDCSYARRGSVCRHNHSSSLSSGDSERATITSSWSQSINQPSPPVPPPMSGCKCYCYKQPSCKHDRFKNIKYDVVSESSSPRSDDNLRQRRGNKTQPNPEQRREKRGSDETTNGRRKEPPKRSSNTSSSYDKKVRDYYKHIKKTEVPETPPRKTGSKLVASVKKILKKKSKHNGCKCTNESKVELKVYNYTKKQWERIDDNQTDDQTRIRGGESAGYHLSETSSQLPGSSSLLQSSSLIAQLNQLHQIHFTADNHPPPRDHRVVAFANTTEVHIKSSSDYSFSIEDLTPTREFSFPMNTSGPVNSPSYEPRSYLKEPPVKDTSTYNASHKLNSSNRTATESEVDSENESNRSSDLSEDVCANILGIPLNKRKKEKRVPKSPSQASSYATHASGRVSPPQAPSRQRGNSSYQEQPIKESADQASLRTDTRSGRLSGYLADKDAGQSTNSQGRRKEPPSEPSSQTSRESGIHLQDPARQPIIEAGNQTRVPPDRYSRQSGSYLGEGPQQSFRPEAGSHLEGQTGSRRPSQGSGSRISQFTKRDSVSIASKTLDQTFLDSASKNDASWDNQTNRQTGSFASKRTDHSLQNSFNQGGGSLDQGRQQSNNQETKESGSSLYKSCTSEESTAQDSTVPTCTCPHCQRQQYQYSDHCHCSECARESGNSQYQYSCQCNRRCCCCCCDSTESDKLQSGSSVSGPSNYQHQCCQNCQNLNQKSSTSATSIRKCYCAGGSTDRSSESCSISTVSAKQQQEKDKSSVENIFDKRRSSTSFSELPKQYPHSKAGAQSVVQDSKSIDKLSNKSKEPEKQKDLDKSKDTGSKCPCEHSVSDVELTESHTSLEAQVCTTKESKEEQQGINRVEESEKMHPFRRCSNYEITSSSAITSNETLPNNVDDSKRFRSQEMHPNKPTKDTPYGRNINESSSFQESPVASARCPAVRLSCRSSTDSSQVSSQNKRNYRSINTMNYIHQPEYCKKVPLPFPKPPPMNCYCECTSFSSSSTTATNEQSSEESSDDEPCEPQFFELPYQNNEEYMDLVQELESTLVNRNRQRVQKTMREFEIRSSQNKNLDKPIFDDDDSIVTEETPILEKISKKIKSKTKNTHPCECCQKKHDHIQKRHDDNEEAFQMHHHKEQKHGDQCGCHESKSGSQRKCEKHGSIANYVTRIVKTMDPNSEHHSRKYPKFQKSCSKSHWELDTRSGEWIKVSDSSDIAVDNSPYMLKHVCNCSKCQYNQSQFSDYTNKCHHKCKCCHCRKKRACR